MIKIIRIIVLNIFFSNILFATEMINITNELVSKNKLKEPPEDNLIKIPKEPQKEKEKEKKKNYKSIMFNDKNINDILNILHLSGNKNTTTNLIDNKSEANDPFEGNNLNIYLNSIMYISKNHWSIWINGNKITNLNNGDGDIIVTAISPLKASFYLSVGLSRWEIINSNNQIPEKKYKIESEGVKLYFSLSPNQTYTPSTNTIIEGKIKREAVQHDKIENINKINQNTINVNENIFF